MLRLADGAERRGALMGAARVLVAASLPGRHRLLSAAQEGEAAQRAQRLLEIKLDGDGTANELEQDLLARMMNSRISSDLSHNLERRQVLRQRRTATRGVQADFSDLLAEAGRAAIAHFDVGVYKPLKLVGFGTAEDAKSPPTAAEFAKAAAAVVAATRARGCACAPRGCEDTPPQPCVMAVRAPRVGLCRRPVCR